MVTIPYPSRASIAPEASVQLAFWNGPPSNCVTGGTRGNPVGLSATTGSAPISAFAARARSAGASVGTGEASAWFWVTSNAIGSSPPGLSGAPVSMKSGALLAVDVGEWSLSALTATVATVAPITAVTRNSASLAMMPPMALMSALDHEPTDSCWTGL